MSFLLLACAISAVSAASTVSALPWSQPFAKLLSEKQSAASDDALDVDLGYAIYRGFANATTNINTWRG